MTQHKSIQPQLLLLEDIVNLGRKGDLVLAKPGFFRNYLLPKKKAVIADKRTIRLQDQLKAERLEQSKEDRKNSDKLALELRDTILTVHVKNDSYGHLFGSVSSVDIVKILKDAGIEVERKQIVLSKPFKMVGEFKVSLLLKEGVQAFFHLKIEGDAPVNIEEPKTAVEVVDEEQSESNDDASDSPPE